MKDLDLDQTSLWAIDGDIEVGWIEGCDQGTNRRNDGSIIVGTDDADAGALSRRVANGVVLIHDQAKLENDQGKQQQQLGCVAVQPGHVR